MEQLAGDVFKAAMGAGPVAALLFYFLRQKQTELDGVRVECKGELDAAHAKVDALQEKIVGMLQAQLEAEPARRATLEAIARSIEAGNAILKNRLRAT